MKDSEIFEAYCDKKDLRIYNRNSNHEYIKKTFSYKHFELEVAVSELKQSIKDAIFEAILKVKGVVKWKTYLN